MTPSASLPLASTIAELRRKVELVRNGEGRAGERRNAVRSACLDVRWAQLDQATMIRDNLAALERALVLAEAGDADAVAALERVGKLAAWEEPRSAVAGRDNTIPISTELDLSELVDVLAELRRHGYDFDRAWATALERVDLAEEDLLRCVKWSAPAWEAAYRRQLPPRGFGLTRWSA